LRRLGQQQVVRGAAGAAAMLPGVVAGAGSAGEIPGPANAGGGVHGMAPPGPTAPDKLRSTPVASITPLNPGAFGPDSSIGLIESPIGCTEILQRLPVLRHHKLIDR